MKAFPAGGNLLKCAFCEKKAQSIGGLKRHSFSVHHKAQPYFECLACSVRMTEKGGHRCLLTTMCLICSMRCRETSVALTHHYTVHKGIPLNTIALYGEYIDNDWNDLTLPEAIHSEKNSFHLNGTGFIKKLNNENINPAVTIDDWKELEFVKKCTSKERIPSHYYFDTKNVKYLMFAMKSHHLNIISLEQAICVFISVSN